MRRGVIILCGGRSSRMGIDKALLPFGNETMLERVARIVGSSIDPQEIVVVAATNQELPALPSTIKVVRDHEEYQGPLPALACGFAALPNADAAFVTGCDAPLLTPEFIEFLFAHLDDADAVVAQDADRMYPLCAVYRTRVSETIERQFTNSDHSLHGLLAKINANHIPVESLREVDPELASLRNVNNHADYIAALAIAGLSTP
jgi:molybdenum cofactor guanylyltransferase